MSRDEICKRPAAHQHTSTSFLNNMMQSADVSNSGSHSLPHLEEARTESTTAGGSHQKIYLITAAVAVLLVVVVVGGLAVGINGGKEGGVNPQVASVDPSASTLEPTKAPTPVEAAPPPSASPSIQSADDIMGTPAPTPTPLTFVPPKSIGPPSAAPSMSKLPSTTPTASAVPSAECFDCVVKPNIVLGGATKHPSIMPSLAPSPLVANPFQPVSLPVIDDVPPPGTAVSPEPSVSIIE
jgi:hypothetical protein